jgi:hypothetical protein
MAVLPGVLGCRSLRRTVQVRLGPIPRYRGTVARWHAHLRGLATGIHEISGLEITRAIPDPFITIFATKGCSYITSIN